ncbi:MAG: copper resistance CopC family protein [Panacagrimonas sp.]
MRDIGVRAGRASAPGNLGVGRATPAAAGHGPPYTLISIGLFVVAMLLASPAWSHAALTKSIPGKREVLSHSPARIELQFNEKVEVKFSTVSLEAAGGAVLPLDRPAPDPDNPYQLNVGIPKPLAAGKYSVNYRVLSQDGHILKNSYSFTVQPPAPTSVEP